MNSEKMDKGFTLVELLISLAISGIIMTGVYSAFKTQQDSYLEQEQVAEMQQNLRASIDYMTRDLRMAGFDPTQSGNFSITDVKIRDLNNGVDVNGNSAISFQVDLDEDGVLDTNETLSYSLFQYPVGAPADQDGIADLSLNQGGGRQLLGESIVAMGLAYSYADDKGDVVTDGGNVVWAIDADDAIDPELDLNIDTNKDGSIDSTDNVAGAALPSANCSPPCNHDHCGADTICFDPFSKASNVPLGNIVAVRIWLLAQTKVQDRNYTEPRTFVVANQRITPNDGNRYRLMETTVKCRNMGL